MGHDDEEDAKPRALTSEEKLLKEREKQTRCVWELVKGVMLKPPTRRTASEINAAVNGLGLIAKLTGTLSPELHKLVTETEATPAEARRLVIEAFHNEELVRPLSNDEHDSRVQGQVPPGTTVN
jgi:hypothetical protein